MVLNSLSNVDKEKLWIPNLVFTNNIGRLFVKNDPLSVLKILPEGTPVNRFDFKNNEHKLYKGSENPLLYENDYDLKLTCETGATLVPF